MEKSKKNCRIEWIDYAKAFACLLVVIGHLLMSLRNIDSYSTITEFIIWFIYLFHMPLFMCLSGLLYYKRNKINSVKEYKKFEFKKIVNLTIPYVTFYAITMILNQLFSSSVNTPKGIKEWLGIINNPISPYWFLYALLSVFIFVPFIEKIFKHKKEIILLFFCFLKVISIFWVPNVYFLKSIMNQGIFFYLGAFVQNNETKDNKQITILLMASYLFIGILIYCIKDTIHIKILELINIIMAVIGTFIVIKYFKNNIGSKILNTFKKYTFQIFLMHTIFAAGIRILLYKVGIYNYFIHIMCGLLFSIYIPVIVSVISDKIKITNFFFYPLKTIEEYKKGN